MSDEPRAYTIDEVKTMFLHHVKATANYWAKLPDKTEQERCDGLAFSILNIFDGTSMGFPACNVSLSPHPDDKAYHQKEGSNWFEPNMMFWDEYLHERYYEVGR